MTLHCVYCKTGSFHLLGSIYGILEIFAQNLHTHITEMFLLQRVLCILFIY